MTTDVPFPMARSRVVKSPLASVTTEERRIFPPLRWLARVGASTSVGMSHIAPFSVFLFCSVSTAKSGRALSFSCELTVNALLLVVWIARAMAATAALKSLIVETSCEIELLYLDQLERYE